MKTNKEIENIAEGLFKLDAPTGIEWQAQFYERGSSNMSVGVGEGTRELYRLKAKQKLESTAQEIRPDSSKSK
jgi:hypothetical protein